jgi:hypothetical protein
MLRPDEDAISAPGLFNEGEAGLPSAKQTQCKRLECSLPYRRFMAKLVTSCPDVNGSMLTVYTVAATNASIPFEGGLQMTRPAIERDSTLIACRTQL